MSGGGEIRVLRQDRQEPGQESPRMPAWKREILERRKAKSGGAGGAAAGEVSPSGAGPQRLKGNGTVVNGSKRDSGGSSSSGGVGGNGRNYTITTASQHFGNNKETRHTTVERTTSKDEDGEESLVLQVRHKTRSEVLSKAGNNSCSCTGANGEVGFAITACPEEVDRLLGSNLY